MSVLIKGMEMPKNCMECAIRSWSSDEYDYVCPFSGIMALNIIGRQNDCPLVEVPENHGKLLDYNALSELVKEDFGYFLARLDLKVPPTVIEAEREEHERTDKGHEDA